MKLKLLINKIKNIKYIDFFVLVCFVVLESLFYFQQLVDRHAYLFSDNAVYAILSKRLLMGDFWNGIHVYWNPGFPIATIPFYLLSGSWEMGQILVSVVSMILLTISIFLFFRGFSKILGLILAFLIAVSVSLHSLVLNGGISEPLYIMLLWNAIYFSWIAVHNGRLYHFFFASLFFALAYLTRTEGLPFFGLFVLIITLKLLYKKVLFHQLTKKELLKLLVAVFIFVLIITPYVISQSLHIRRFTISGKYAYIGSGPYYALEKYRPTTWAQDVWAVDFSYYKSPYFDPQHASKWMNTYIKNGSFVQTAQKSTFEIFQHYRSVNTDNFFTGWGFVLTLVGVVCGLISKYRVITLYFTGMWLIGVGWVAAFMSPHYRYIIFAVPFFLYLEGLGIYYISKTIAGLSMIVLKKKFIKWMIFTVSVLFFIGLIFNQNMTFDNFIAPTPLKSNEDAKLIGEWIKEHNIKIIGGRMESIELYSDAKIIYMPSITPNEIVKYMKDWGVEYLLVRPLEVGYAHVAPIADPGFSNSDLSLFHKFGDGSLIWKIKLTEKERIDNQQQVVLRQWD